MAASLFDSSFDWFSNTFESYVFRNEKYPSGASLYLRDYPGQSFRAATMYRVFVNQVPNLQIIYTDLLLQIFF
jgi:hypothetical protein